MQINVDVITKAQVQLDQTIQTKHHVTYQSVYDELKLALIVELGELANEVKCFKFWSVKGPSDRHVILEEYVDGIHFIGSLSIAHKVDTIYEIPDHIQLLDKKSLTKRFNELFLMMDTLNKPSGIKRWYQEYLVLGYQLGFKIDDIINGYFAKNKINFDRQANNY